MTPPSADPAAFRRLDDLARFGMRLGLERTRALLAALGSPEVDLPVVLVAGTNGKGTVAALLDSFARAAKLKRVGLYTSPNLERVEERIRVDGAPIATDRLAELIDEVLDAAAGMDSDGDEPAEPPTYFEALTVAALLHFARERCRLVVLEVGLGGRLDATNVCRPLLSVVTSIGLDHTEHLGESLEEIAREKAGIFRPDTPAVSGVEPDSEAGRALATAALATGTPLTVAPAVLAIEALQRFHPFPSSDPSDGGDPRRLRVWLESRADDDDQDDRSRGSRGRDDVEVFELALAGRHQAENLRTAVVAARTLRALGEAKTAEGDGERKHPFEKLTERALKNGSKRCRWPARLEEVVVPPQAGVRGLADGARLLLDAAHNPDGTATLAEYLGTVLEPDLAKTAEAGAPTLDLLFGVLQDKRVDEMLVALLGAGSGDGGSGLRFGRITLTTPLGDRGRPAAELEARVRKLARPDGTGGTQGKATGRVRVDGSAEVVVEPDPRRATDRALAALGGRVLVVCGSLALVGTVRAHLRVRFGVPDAP